MKIYVLKHSVRVPQVEKCKAKSVKMNQKFANTT